MRHAEPPLMSQVIAVWIGRDEEGRAAAVLYCHDESKHYCVREDGKWKLIAVDAAGQELAVGDEPELSIDPVEVAATLHKDEVLPPFDPNMN
jgi:hypothetical protein